ncbi:MAG: alpha/beta hydrolase [Bryobacterales bacterium]|nr:alpha/beta hydrolase [Bryobacterales bacterium]
MADARIELPDGRRLGYALYGDPYGTPVLYFHGGLSSRLDIAFGDEASRLAHVRLIAIDRPGIGLSDPHPDAVLPDWAVDVRCFADTLGLERFCVLAWSAGAPYALACAHQLPARVTRTGIVAGIGPLLDREAIRQLGLIEDRLLYPLCRRMPWLAALVLRAASWLPPRVARFCVLAQFTSPSDREIFSSLTPREATGFFYEAVRNGPAGVIEDYRTTGRDWRFTPAEIAGEVIFWHGAEDRLAPVSNVRALAAEIPRARLIVSPGRGHLLLWRDLPAILELISAAPSAES